jgi:5-formyltetrahydrofolate cyclo-ligase
MIYLPLAGEADAGLVAAAAWREGKTVLAPKVDWTTETMAPARIQSLEEEMLVGRHGVRSPQDGSIWPVGDIDLIVAPALAIDRQGNRLGRGGGFYDRFLCRPGVRACVCALVHHEQLVGELPHVAHDMPVDMAVTDQEVLRFARSPKTARAR